MTARENERRATRPALTVDLAIDDAELADRVRSLLAHTDLEIAGADDPRAPQVRITDGVVGLAGGVPVLVLTDTAGALEALQAGAAAVLSETTDGRALHTAVRAVAQGLTALSAEFREHIFDGPAERASLDSDGEEPPAIELTARELQVLGLLAEGASNKAIARQLGITPSTAKFHVASIVAKLGANGRTDAVAKAMRFGLFMV